MKSQIYNHGGPTYQKVTKVAKPSSSYHIGTSTSSSKAEIGHRPCSFKPIGVSEVSGEPELRENRFDFNTIEIEDLQDDEFTRNFNTPLTDLNDHVIVKVRPFDSPIFGVPMGKIMSTAGESSFVFTSATPTEGVLAPPVSTPRSSIPTTPLTRAS